MSTYRKVWGCCDSVSETDSWEPEVCPFCTPDKPAEEQELMSYEAHNSWTALELNKAKKRILELEQQQSSDSETIHRLLVLAMKHCEQSHRGWIELKKIATAMEQSK